MNRLLILIIFSVIALSASSLLKEAKEAHWAVLVAGSNGYWNYRHQSDMCHAYQLLIKNGMPASRIITLAFDDIANAYENPFPGQIFNKPDPTGKGVDVYANCKLDYTGDEVTPKNFLNVLKGDAAANLGKGTGRVLGSNANDKVFVYFTDHGATGLIAFPNDYLYADKLIETLKYMHENAKYKRLVFYLEACESGSMFEGLLPLDWEIYATTAANTSESSYASYCQPDDVINGKSIGTCLGDEYSVIWMEDTEAAEEGKFLQKQFEDVLSKTKGSHVQQYGIINWAKEEALKNYQGDVAKFSSIDKLFNKIQKCANKFLSYFNSSKKTEIENYKLYLEKAKSSKIDSRDAKLHYLAQKHKALRSNQSESDLNKEIIFRREVDNFFSHFDIKFEIKTLSMKNVTDFSCLRHSINQFKSLCKPLFDEYTLKYIRHLYTACEQSSADEIEFYLKSTC